MCAKIMEETVKRVGYYVGKSETSKRIVSVFREGSSPSRKQIQNLYVMWSKSQSRKKKFDKRRNMNVYISVEATKKRKASSLHRQLTRIGFWT